MPEYTSTSASPHSAFTQHRQWSINPDLISLRQSFILAAEIGAAAAAIAMIDATMAGTADIAK
jgi:hypothetical protein